MHTGVCCNNMNAAKSAAGYVLLMGGYVAFLFGH
jgi:hypothetical protein